eukprot:TRINITY_DN38806_c0_g1_i1.p1 TRINITY_DN38806_c0_g1~~TRINITY_DN38806_c0_g1_i1.p1  ORF type:complete len:608 (+),score=155.46 TRINITY_DN38806_c0_g1_i1:330-2153(+)
MGRSASPVPRERYRSWKNASSSDEDRSDHRASKRSAPESSSRRGESNGRGRGDARDRDDSDRRPERQRHRSPSSPGEPRRGANRWDVKRDDRRGEERREGRDAADRREAPPSGVRNRWDDSNPRGERRASPSYDPYKRQIEAPRFTQPPAAPQGWGGAKGGAGGAGSDDDPDLKGLEYADYRRVKRDKLREKLTGSLWNVTPSPSPSPERARNESSPEPVGEELSEQERNGKGSDDNAADPAVRLAGGEEKGGATKRKEVEGKGEGEGRNEAGAEKDPKAAKGSESPAATKGGSEESSELSEEEKAKKRTKAKRKTRKSKVASSESEESEEESSEEEDSDESDSDDERQKRRRRSLAKRKGRSRSRRKESASKERRRKSSRSARHSKHKSKKRRVSETESSEEDEKNKKAASESATSSGEEDDEADRGVRRKTPPEPEKEEEEEILEYNPEAMELKDLIEAQKRAAAIGGLDAEPLVGPAPAPRAEGHISYGGAMRPGEGDAIAQYVQQGKRIPRRGEVGLSADEISHFENLGYVMSGSRHQRMNAIRIRKENQVYSAEDKRALAMFNYEEKAKREHKVMSDLQRLVQRHVAAENMPVRAEDVDLIG